MSQEQPKLTKEQVQRYLKGEPVLEYGYEENFLGALATEWLDQRRVLEQLEWVQHTSADYVWSECPICYQTKKQGHAADCELGKVLS